MKHALLLVPALLAACATAAAADLPTIPAYLKKPASGKIRRYPTRTLAQLSDFHPGAPNRDEYGGLADITRPATGFFHPEQLDGRWYLIDPLGHPYIHVGITTVAIENGPTFKAAFKEKFQTPDRWRDQTAALLHDTGFTGTGAWSSDALLRSGDHPLVYTPLISMMAAYGKKRGGTYQQPGHLGFPNDCIFVFDPEFETFADQQAQKLAARKDDPWLLGYYSDNELPFKPLLLKQYLGLPDSDPGHAAALQWISDHHLSPDHLADADLEAFRGFVADRYYRICSNAIKKYDPNHLYLGSRNNSSERNCKPFLAAESTHVDVVSVNVYGNWSPAEDIRKWSSYAAKPMLVTEFYAKGNDSGMLNETGAGWTVPTQKDRGDFYQHFTLELLESKCCVGWTWFKYADNDPLDLSTDPSNRNSNKGLINSHYEPYAPLQEAMHQLNVQVFPLIRYFDQPH
ncbi:MAG: agarase [Phycisphaerae bacterium]